MRLSFRMKGAVFGLGAKAISLVMIALMFLSIFIWQCQKTALLTVFHPPQSSSHMAPRIAGGEIEETVNWVEVKTNNSSGSAVLEKYIAENKKIRREDGSTPRAIDEVQREDKQLIKDNGLRRSGNNSDPVVSVNSTSTYINSSISRKDDENSTAIEDVRGRNIAKGKWVVDEKRPLYSGFGCKRWLSTMWACRTSHRRDFSYEKLRWQPKNFQMEEFEASKFLTRMKDKTLAFIGDSLGRQQFQSLMCMISGGEEQNVKDVGKDYGLVLAPGSKRPNGWAYNFPTTNTTVLYYWSASLCDLQPINKTNQETDFAMHLDRPPGFLQKFIRKFDVLVLNTGHHWNRGKLNANRWVIYVGGKPNSNKKIALLSNAKNLTVHSIVQWVNSQLPHNPSLKAFYRTISPRHFVRGEWNTGGSCDNTMPMSIGKEVLQDKSSDEMAAMAVKGTGVKLLDITALSQVRDEAHISRFSRTTSIGGAEDCLHWCLPGVPDTWNEILFAQI